VFREGEKKLKLDTIANGYDSLQIRIWYNFPKCVGDEILCLKRQNSIWSATFRNRSTKENLPIKPKCDWSVLMNKLYSYNILNLPDMHDIKGCHVVYLDPSFYSVEISDKYHYRLYSYIYPERFYNKRFKDVRNMMRILKLIREEFGIKLISD
jgi:hypothetical protein